MKIIVNGCEREISGVRTIEDFLAQKELDPQRVAIERNSAIVPREQFAQTPLEDGDRIEVVHFVGGG